MNPAEANATHWSLSKEATGRLITAADQSAGLRDEQQERFAAWEIDVPTGRALTETLILLGVHAAVRDDAWNDANTSRVTPGRLDLHSIAESLRTRPQHELFASLPATLADQDARRIDQLRLMSYSVTSRSTLSLERLVQEAAMMIRAAADAVPGPTQTLGDLLWPTP
ncbi:MULTISPECIES: hypothetical protein [Streptomyces]|uniref:Uncharacterized protein n=1 Tax=Streptomyces lonegramiae TaxID=3075524 RepID=A0ABU2XPR4_9ACTN|nr:hypothetical protein [Streptomyces sp. DSM 41529]MDT0547928.1 hypothetical protein [Streptomyces sp. DSM 41529]